MIIDTTLNFMFMIQIRMDTDVITDSQIILSHLKTAKLKILKIG